MQQVLHERVTVQPGGRVELVCPELKAGDVVDVVVSASLGLERCWAWQAGDEDSRPRRSVLDILDEAPGHLLFKTALEVD